MFQQFHSKRRNTILFALIGEVIAKPRRTSASDLPLSLAVFRNLFAGNILRQNLLRSGAAYQLRWTCKTNVLQVALGNMKFTR